MADMVCICDTCRPGKMACWPRGGEWAYVDQEPTEVCKGYRKRVDTNWERMFGTSEKTAEYFALQCFGSDGDICGYCPLFDDCDESLRNSGSYPIVHDAILKWLESEGGE